ncbi:MAG: hydrogenase maturation protease [Lentisphaerae bacterium]|nr:hydrogenase maturation protease [Lentisphaerota bacterium]
MNPAPQRTLVIGFGNPGRLDDGLGPAAAAALEADPPAGVTVESDYQLTVEDAHAVAGHDVTVFVDADAAGPEPFGWSRVAPRTATGFSSHGVEPADVVGLARDLFGSRAGAYLLGIRGYRFDGFGETLSPPARRNLDAAVAFLRHALESRVFPDATDGAAALTETGG